MPENRLQSSEPSTSPSLIRRAQDQDRVAWERISLVYGPLVYQWARQHGMQSQDAADIMQDVLHAVTTNIGRFQTTGGTFRGWLWTITRNKVRDHHRTQAKREQALGGTDAYGQLQRMAEAPAARNSDDGQSEMRGIHRRALELMQTDFEPQTWQAFWRTAVDVEPPAEVAASLGVSKWTVYKARSRVLQRLRDEFADLLE